MRLLVQTASTIPDGSQMFQNYRGCVKEALTVPGPPEGRLNNSGSDQHSAIQRLPMRSTDVISWYPVCTPVPQRRFPGHLLTVKECWRKMDAPVPSCRRRWHRKADQVPKVRLYKKMEDPVLAGLKWLDMFIQTRVFSPWYIREMVSSHILVRHQSLPSPMGLQQGPELKHQCKSYVMPNSEDMGSDREKVLVGACLQSRWTWEQRCKWILSNQQAVRREAMGSLCKHQGHLQSSAEENTLMSRFSSYVDAELKYIPVCFRTGRNT